MPPALKSVLTTRQLEVAEHMLDGTTDSTMGSTLATPKVREYVKGQRQELSTALQIKRADVVDGMMEAIDMAKLAADPMAMIRGWSEIAKMLGLYAPEVKKVEMSINGNNILSKYEAMTDEELIAIVEGNTFDGEVVENRLQ